MIYLKAEKRSVVVENHNCKFKLMKLEGFLLIDIIFGKQHS